MRVVDDDGEGLAGIDGLKAAGDGLKTRDGFDEIVEGDAARMGRGECGEQIEDVDFAGETRGDLRGAGGCFEIE